jgi:putative transcriptional regulator
MKRAATRRTKLGRDIEAAFIELGAVLRGDAVAEEYDADSNAMTASRIKSIRRGVASSTKEFERQFHVPARTMEAYEQGRRAPDSATEAFLRVIESEPETVRRVLQSKAA